MFSQFTNQYSLSKTLRFELKPISKTAEMLKENNVFEIDKTIKEKYEQTKPFIDLMHREFIEEACRDNIALSQLSEYLEIINEYKRDPKNAETKSRKNKIEEKLRKELMGIINSHAETWNKQYASLKRSDYNILFEEAVFGSILKVRYGEQKDAFIKDESTGEMVSIFDGWKGFTGYFDKFFEARKNIYKTDGTSTAFATRAIDQNLYRFTENIVLFNKAKQHIDFSKVEKDLGVNLNNIFTIDNYNNCLLQKDINKYNEVLSGKPTEYGDKIQGINELINEFRQTQKEIKLSFLKKLDKQILGVKESSFKLDAINDENELIELLKEISPQIDNKVNLFTNLIEDFVENNAKFDLEKIYISKEAFNTIRFRWFVNPSIVFEELAKILKLKPDENEGYKFKEGFVSLASIKATIEAIVSDENESIYKSDYATSSDRWRGFLFIYKSELLKQVSAESQQELKNLLQSDHKIGVKEKETIKQYLDYNLCFYQMAKYFALEKHRAWDDVYETCPDFYDNPDYGYMLFYQEAFGQFVKSYNKIRNYLTKKPYSEEKWKLNFENPTLADGWDKNKETSNFTVILRKDGKYYLAIMKKGNNKIFENILPEDGMCYEKMTYKQVADPKRDFPKGVFSAKGLEIYKPSNEILKIYKNGEFKTSSQDFSLDSLWKLIDFLKKCVSTHPSWRLYDFDFSETKSYKNINEFYTEVSNRSYKIWWENISAEYIINQNEKRKLYLFEIHNKDWNKQARGAKNLHTIYFESVFSDENTQANFPIKLNGQAELFFRPATDKAKLGEHKDKHGTINHKRYAEDKVFFHVPITLNRTKQEARRFNAEVNNYLADNSNINVIGIDRGEKHIAYYSVIDQKGNIIESASFNTINGVGYYTKLAEREAARRESRQNWQAIEDIKNLKKGFVSQAVRKIADLSIEHNAIIVLEDLNMRFKQIRGGVERSAYQQLEKALIDKLSYLVDKKENNPTKPGHVLKAYQLAAPFTSFQDMGKQTGIVYYTQAPYTSKIDPVTGWRPNLYLKYKNAESAKKDILKFKSIDFDGKKFSFTYNLADFRTDKKASLPNKAEWTICSCVERYRWNKKKRDNQGDYDHYQDVTENIKELFEANAIDLQKSILDQISNIETSNAKFFKDLTFFIGLICQIRNTDPSKTGDDNDFILSPVKPFFDSRRAKEFGKNLPKNGDENGAYNIARKGIMILNRITETKTEEGNCNKANLYLTQTDWDNFTQK